MLLPDGGLLLLPLPSPCCLGNQDWSPIPAAEAAAARAVASLQSAQQYISVIRLVSPGIVSPTAGYTDYTMVQVYHTCSHVQNKRPVARQVCRMICANSLTGTVVTSGAIATRHHMTSQAHACIKHAILHLHACISYLSSFAAAAAALAASRSAFAATFAS